MRRGSSSPPPSGTLPQRRTTVHGEALGSPGQPPQEGREMAVTKIIEVVGSSPESSDAAVEAALSDAGQSLRNIKAVDVVSTGLRGENLDEWRALVRISFLVERVSEEVRLDDISAPVAGGASGLGEATARELASRGARVTIADVNQERGEALA